jgi:hypothetical protein
VVELLARTGMRKGELLALTTDAVVQIGSAYWLRIPLGKLHNDRYIPLHPELKALLDDQLARRPQGLRSNLLFVHRGRPITAGRVDRALAKVALAAGIGHVTAHQLRHTPATQAINRGMSLDAIAALLGHKTLAMTTVHARIADRTVAEEYFAVTAKVEALYGQPAELPADDEGHQMRRLRAEITAACSATATAPAPSRWIATSSPSASPAPSSSPPSSSAPPSNGSATTPSARASSAVSASSTASWSASTSKALDTITRISTTPTAARRHSAGAARTSMRPPTTPSWQHNPHHPPSKPIPWASGSPPSGKPGQPQEYQKTAAVTSSAISRGC